MSKRKGLQDQPEVNPNKLTPTPGDETHLLISKASSQAQPGIFCTEFPLIFRIRGSVISVIWRQVILVTFWTAVVVTAYITIESIQFKWKTTLIQLMGVVCGLLLAFRSNSAYDRYWEGRKYWSTMTQGIRTLTRAIWINVKEESSSDIVEKKSAINLLIAFAIATKHYLREEYDYDYEDLRNLTGHIEWLRTPSSTQPLESQVDEKQSQAPLSKQQRYKAHDIATPTNIPLELSYHIGSYISSIRIREKCDNGTIGTMNSALGSLVECLTGFERILRTPIPLAYSIHLHQSIWIYILALPFQLVPENGWWTILIVGLATFFLLGILAIGKEIENPFGYDDNDLPLDDFCKVLRREIEVIVSHRAKFPEEWVFKSSNKPFLPSCNLNAIELATRSLADVQKILVNRDLKFSGSNVELTRRGGDRTKKTK